jgi:hypothetical protein
MGLLTRLWVVLLPGAKLFSTYTYIYYPHFLLWGGYVIVKKWHLETTYSKFGKPSSYVCNTVTAKQKDILG